MIKRKKNVILLEHGMVYPRKDIAPIYSWQKTRHHKVKRNIQKCYTFCEKSSKSDNKFITLHTEVTLDPRYATSLETFNDINFNTEGIRYHSRDTNARVKDWVENNEEN